MSTIRKKGSDKDQCNLCRRSSLCLSNDHVPPQSVQRILNVNIEPNFPDIEPNFPDAMQQRIILSQNGVKFRTICSQCNNRLGSDYDAQLAEFIGQVASLYDHVFRRYFIQTDTYDVEIDINAVFRSLCGHIVAAKSFIDDTPMDTAIRSFIFDTTQPIPNHINIFYWLYPHYEVRIKRDFVYFAQECGNQQFFGSILKFYPLAFFFTDSQSFMECQNLRSYLTSDGSATKIPVYFKESQLPSWPEGDRRGIALGPVFHGRAGSEAIIGYFRPRKR